MRFIWGALTLACAALLLGAGVSCTNNPYPGADDDAQVLYLAFSEPPKTLDPQVAYSTTDHAITGKVYDTLLEYHYLKRPYTLIPSMAASLPERRELSGGQVEYVFTLRDGLRFADDACFEGGKGRPITAADFVFSLRRIADPAVSSPVVDQFSNLVGFTAFKDALTQRRKADAAFGARTVSEQYAEISRGLGAGFVGAEATGDQTLTIRLNEAYPQILYWFAMNFSSPVPHEAVEYYDGEAGRPLFAEHPVASGAYMLSDYQKQSRMVLVHNPSWYGAALGARGSLASREAAEQAPAAVFPSVDSAANSAVNSGVGPSDPDYQELKALAGRILPLAERIEYRMEKETIPAFSKFLQGYYDLSGIARESFDRVVHEGGLSKDMQAAGMNLTRSVVPGIYYIGFNMDDPVIGRAGGERARLIRQAMSLSIDVSEYLRLFQNSRGQLAESVVPPGLFGHDEAYKNPYRRVNLSRARELLVQAGLPEGVDPKTQKPLRLTFDVPDTSPEGRLRFLFWVNQWRRLGLDVSLDATNYNKFQEKVRDGAYQIFQWGWIADYPDPENFLFLLTSQMARSESGGPNTANFKDERYDQLFSQMRTRADDAERLRMIQEMRSVLETERPWIELFHPEEYALVQGWVSGVRPAGLSIPTAKYNAVDPQKRAALRAARNEPVLWPAFALVLFILLVLAPGVVTFYRERQ